MHSIVSLALLLAASASASPLEFVIVSNKPQSASRPLINTVYTSLFGPYKQRKVGFFERGGQPVWSTRASDFLPQVVGIVPDTASQVSWIRSAYCYDGNQCNWATQSESSSIGLSVKAITRSPSEKKSVTQVDGTQVECYNTTAYVSVAGNLVKSKDICAATYIDAPKRQRFDGVLGLGNPDSINTDSLVNKMFSNVVKQYRMISFWYKRGVNTPQFNAYRIPAKVFASVLELSYYRFYIPEWYVNSYSGEMTIGLPNNKRYSSRIIWIPHIASEKTWTVEFNGLLIGDKFYQTPQSHKKAIVSTGFPLTYLPAELFKTINAYMDGTPTLSGRYSIPCVNVPKFPTLKITINGHLFAIQWYDQFMLADDGRCYSIFAPISENHNQTVLGAGFLRTLHTTFDYANKRIGFAKRTN